MDFAEGGVAEFADTGLVGALKIVHPAVLKAPLAAIGVPEDALGEDAASKRESCGIELEDGEVGEFVAIAVEELVIKDAAGLTGARMAEDPGLLGMKDGLRRAALDDVAQLLLAAIGLGQVELVEQEEADGENRGDRHDGNDQAVQADAGGLHGDDFAVAIEHAEGDQHGDEHGQRSDGVKHAGGEVDQVKADGGERGVVADDVADQLKEGEDEHEQHEAAQDQEKHAQELAQDVLIEDAGKRAAVGAAGDARTALK